MKTTKTRSRDN